MEPLMAIPTTPVIPEESKPLELTMKMNIIDRDK